MNFAHNLKLLCNSAIIKKTNFYNLHDPPVVHICPSICVHPYVSIHMCPSICVQSLSICWLTTLKLYNSFEIYQHLYFDAHLTLISEGLGARKNDIIIIIIKKNSNDDSLLETIHQYLIVLKITFCFCKRWH